MVSQPPSKSSNLESSLWLLLSGLAKSPLLPLARSVIRPKLLYYALHPM
ncbi:hypothetical protein ANDA3_1278 [plant metagenome]|uniref:Uncharacterized protein n=1 Tax=plant metagenome TaxID=1297885 RepID=A0A484PDJ6_9ZZZZ